MSKRTYIISLVMACTITNLQAQTYNDSVRTDVWSIFVQGGLSHYWHMRGGDYSDSRQPVSPDFSIGLQNTLRPWVRLGFKAEYTMAKATGRAIRIGETAQEGYMVGDYTTTLHTTIDRVQNRNNMNIFMTDFNAQFNVMDIWHRRKAQDLNIWLGTGIGYWHAWNRNSQTYSYNEEAVTKGDTYFNVYTHKYVKSQAHKHQGDAFYIPLSLSAEYDITPRWTAGLMTEYKWLPIGHEFTPKSLLNAGVLLRYNFVGSKMPSNKALLDKSQKELQEQRENCGSQARYMEQLLDDKADLKRQLEAKQRELELLKQQLGNPPQTEQSVKTQASSTIANQHEVLFDLGWTKMSAQEQLRLDDYLAQWEDAEHRPQLIVTGEASADGKSDRNQRLSEARLQRVLDYLLQKGWGASAIKEEKAIGDSNQGMTPHYRRVTIIAE